MFGIGLMVCSTGTAKVAVLAVILTKCCDDNRHRVCSQSYRLTLTSSESVSLPCYHGYCVNSAVDGFGYALTSVNCYGAHVASSSGGQLVFLAASQ